MSAGATLPRDPRELHDQIIDHDLVGFDERKLLALLVIELRRLRQQLAELFNREGGDERSEGAG